VTGSPSELLVAFQAVPWGFDFPMPLPGGKKMWIDVPEEGVILAQIKGGSGWKYRGKPYFGTSTWGGVWLKVFFRDV